MRAIFSTVMLLLIAVGSGRAVDMQILLPLYSYPNWYAGAAAYQWDDVAAAASQVFQYTRPLGPDEREMCV